MNAPGRRPGLNKLWHFLWGFVILGGDLLILAGFVKLIGLFVVWRAGEFVFGCERIGDMNYER